LNVSDGTLPHCNVLSLLASDLLRRLCGTEQYQGGVDEEIDVSAIHLCSCLRRLQEFSGNLKVLQHVRQGGLTRRVLSAIRASDSFTRAIFYPSRLLLEAARQPVVLEAAPRVYDIVALLCGNALVLISEVILC